MQEFARQETARRMSRVLFELRNCRQSLDEKRIHDLRVALRRFIETLRVMKDLLPPKEAKRIRRALGDLMDPAGKVRNYDITIGLLRDAGAPLDSALVIGLVREREHNGRLLEEVLLHEYQRDVSTHWRNLLGLAG
jgi:CHAD domain-containing protein